MKHDPFKQSAGWLLASLWIWPAAIRAGTAAGATNDTAPALPAVTVTAGKREQALERVPASVTAIDGEALAERGASSIQALAHAVPGLSFQPFGQAGVNSPVMRGLSAQFTSFSSSVLLLVDGVPTLMAQGFDDPLLDVERVEVLRGPQSTLYGRNAEAGVIHILTRPPDGMPAAAVSLEAGSRGKFVARASVNQPLVADTLYASLAGAWSRQDGFIDNTLTGNHADDRRQDNARLALRWTPSARTEATLRYTRQDYHDGAAQWGSPSAPRTTVASGWPSWNRSSGQSFALDVAHDFGGGLRLRSLTAHSEFLDRVQQDTDFQPADRLHIGRDHRFRTLTQELRLEGRLGAAEWLTGLYGEFDDHDLHNTQKLPIGPNGGLSDSRVSQRGDTVAAFTQWTVPLATRWSLSTGARVERNAVRISPQGAGSRADAWTRFSPRLALQFAPAPEHRLHASYSQGFRAGGFNVFSPAVGYSAYAPETTRAYEIGAKGRLSAGRLRYAAALYWMDVSNMQVQQMPVPGLVYITNAATASSRGAELELDYLLGANWQLLVSGAYNRMRFGSFRDGASTYDGHRNPFAPDLSGRMALRYSPSTRWFAQAALTASGRVYLDAANRYARNGYATVDLNAGYTFGRAELTAYLNNAFDRRYDSVGYQNGNVTVYSPPREFGVRLTWRL